MKRILSVLALLAVCSCQAVAKNSSLSLILPPNKGPALLRQCSRPTPGDVKSYWKPTREQISILEHELVGFLKQNAFGERIFPLSKYHRQYIGFVKNGKRYIYGNFYTTTLNGKSSSTEPVSVCDGGKNYWGIVYSVESRQFHQAVSNGPA